MKVLRKILAFPFRLISLVLDIVLSAALLISLAIAYVSGLFNDITKKIKGEHCIHNIYFEDVDDNNIVWHINKYSIKFTMPKKEKK